MKDFLPKLLFAFALASLCFAYGFISHWKEIFPYQMVKEAYTAFRALIELGDERPQGIDFYEAPTVTGRQVRQLAPGAGDEALFILGNQFAFGEQPGGARLAWLADRQGNILHSWAFPDDLWAPLEKHSVVGNAWDAYPVGAHLMPDGDIIVSYQGTGVFPIPMGIARFDKDSNLVWKNPDYYHHWFDVYPDGRIIVPEARLEQSPLQFPDHEKFLVCDEGTFANDVLAILSPDGEKIDEIDLLQSFLDSDLVGLFNSNKEDHEFIDTCDPMHLNDVRILSAEDADAFAQFEAGDLLMSFRSLNTVAVLDPDTKLFKWHYTGAMHHQHSPRFLPDRQVLAFDNRGGGDSRGISRVLAIDVINERTRSVFPPVGATLPERPFYSATAGHIDIAPSHDRVLVSWTHQGLIWEVDIASGEVLWEWVNTHNHDGQPARISVYTAKYVPEITFALNGAPSG